MKLVTGFVGLLQELSATEERKGVRNRCLSFWGVRQ
jgi:hypothetical protein